MDGSVYRMGEISRHFPALAETGGRLVVDLGAITRNWHRLQRLAPQAEVAAVVKADAYGLGAESVATRLQDAGCRSFFVAHLCEALALRRHLAPDTRLIVLHGAAAGTEAVCAEVGVIPVLNTPTQLAAWTRLARDLGRKLPALLQLDTGMTRFGLAEADLSSLLPLLSEVDLQLVMSHLACADTPEHPANAAQLANFTRMRAQLPPAPASLAASSGIFHGPHMQFDLVRPGAALYGLAPLAGQPNPLEPTIRLDGVVMQLRDVQAGTALGYGHTAITKQPSRLATIAIGYADGFRRALSNQGCVWHGDTALPIVGRISMDSLIADATNTSLAEGDLVELIGPHRTPDDVARDSDTIGYEILTGLGTRCARQYI